MTPLELNILKIVGKKTPIAIANQLHVSLPVINRTINKYLGGNPMPAVATSGVFFGSRTVPYDQDSPTEPLDRLSVPEMLLLGSSSPGYPGEVMVIMFNCKQCN